MIESCIVAVPTATWPNSERPMISLRYTKSMNGRPPPPISAGCPSAHRPRALASAWRSAIGPLLRRVAESPGPGTPCDVSRPRCLGRRVELHRQAGVGVEVVLGEALELGLGLDHLVVDEAPSSAPAARGPRRSSRSVPCTAPYGSANHPVPVGWPRPSEGDRCSAVTDPSREAEPAIGTDRRQTRVSAASA